jgi:hypothetical protein
MEQKPVTPRVERNESAFVCPMKLPVTFQVMIYYFKKVIYAYILSDFLKLCKSFLQHFKSLVLLSHNTTGNLVQFATR